MRMTEIFDGFRANLISLPALKNILINKILSLNKEGDSSSFNQTYNEEVNKSEQNMQRMNLSYL